VGLQAVTPPLDPDALSEQMRRDRELRDDMVRAKIAELGATTCRTLADELDLSVPMVTAALTRLREGERALKVSAACPCCGARGRLSLWMTR
jgi:hypothetical protein